MEEGYIIRTFAINSVIPDLNMGSRKLNSLQSILNSFQRPALYFTKAIGVYVLPMVHVIRRLSNEGKGAGYLHSG